MKLSEIGHDAKHGSRLAQRCYRMPHNAIIPIEA